jgi:hypothetical protein
LTTILKAATLTSVRDKESREFAFNKGSLAT